VSLTFKKSLSQPKKKVFYIIKKGFLRKKKVIKQKEKKFFSTHRNIQAVQQKQPVPLLVLIPG
jgi:hypothetical protein